MFDLEETVDDCLSFLPRENHELENCRIVMAGGHNMQADMFGTFMYPAGLKEVQVRIMVPGGVRDQD
jgi:hypothetical protein